MKYLKILFCVLFFVILSMGCSKNDGVSIETGTKESIASETEQLQDTNIKRKLIKEGRVMFETNDVDATRKIIFESVKKYDAYIASDRESKSNNQVNNTLIIRVPRLNFDKLLNEATKGITKFENKDIDIKDVTEEFLDIQARIKTKKELENRYLELLKKANKVTEILEVEKQIGLLRSDIESIEGRLKYIKNKVSFSTLTITFYQTVPNKIAFGNKFKEGFENGWDNLIWFFVLLVNIWPFIIIGLGLGFGIFFWRRKKSER